MGQAQNLALARIRRLRRRVGAPTVRCARSGTGWSQVEWLRVDVLRRPADGSPYGRSYVVSRASGQRPLARGSVGACRLQSACVRCAPAGRSAGKSGAPPPANGTSSARRRALIATGLSGWTTTTTSPEAREAARPEPRPPRGVDRYPASSREPPNTRGFRRPRCRCRRACHGEREVDRALGVQAGGVEDRHRRVVGADEQVDLGAAEQDALRAAVGEVAR